MYIEIYIYIYLIGICTYTYACDRIYILNMDALANGSTADRYTGAEACLTNAGEGERSPALDCWWWGELLELGCNNAVSSTGEVGRRVVDP